MIIIILLISITLLATQCTSQECFFDPNKYTEITCSDIETIEEVQDKVNETLNPYGPVERLLRVLELERCTLLNFTINSLSFLLPELEEIKISKSNVTRLAPEEDDDSAKNTIDFDDGTSRKSANGMCKFIPIN